MIADKQTIDKRRRMCNSCIHQEYTWGLLNLLPKKCNMLPSLKTCGVCKCLINSKTSLSISECPIKKW